MATKWQKESLKFRIGYATCYSTLYPTLCKMYYIIGYKLIMANLQDGSMIAQGHIEIMQLTLMQSFQIKTENDKYIYE